MMHPRNHRDNNRDTLTLWLTLSIEQERALAALSRSPRRDEADRARAVLMSAAGKSSTEIAPLLGVRAEQIRRWRTRFRNGGVEGLRTRPHTGRPDTKAQTALCVVQQVLRESAANLGEQRKEGRANLDPSWTCPRLAKEIERRTGVSITAAHLSVVLRQKGGTGGNGPGTRSKGARIKTPSSAPACD
jgi:transposase